MTYRNLVQMLQDQVAADKGITFIQSSSVASEVTYRELLHNSSLLLRQLQDKGLKPGDELVFQIEQNQLFLHWFWACMLGGIIPVPLTPGGSEENKIKLMRVWNKLNHPFLVAENNFWKRHNTVTEHNEFDTFLAGITMSGRTLEADISELSGEPGTIHDASPEQIAFIQFSSGSTGQPKGVMLTHANLIANMQAIVDCSGATGIDSSLSWMPLTHDMGLIGFHLTPILAGMSQYLMSTALFIQHPTLWLSKANDHQITTLASPNFGYKHFLAHYKPEQAADWDLSSVKLIFNGAEPISASLCRQFLQEMKSYGLSQNVMFPVYGMAEASLAVTFPPAGQPLVSVDLLRGLMTGLPIKEYSVDGNDNDEHGNVSTEGDSGSKAFVTFVDLGYPVNDCEARICSDQDEIYSEGIIGDIQIRGKNVSNGYYNDENATRLAITEDGWFRTGDLGFFRNGRLVVTGRKKDVMFVNGQNIYPHDLEAILEEDEGGNLRRVAVCGVFNEQLQSDEIIVFVLFRGKIQSFIPHVEQVERQIKLLTGYEVGLVLPVRQLPKTTSGKIQRYLLVQKFIDGEFREVQQEVAEWRRNLTVLKTAKWSEDELERKLQEISSQVLGTGTVDIDDSFFQSGGNSLKAAMFVSAVWEQAGVEIPIRDIYGTATIRELADRIRKSGPTQFAGIGQADKRDNYPLTGAQYRVYVQEQMEHIGASYNIPAALDITGPFEVHKAEQVYYKLIERHESLRTSFHIIEGEVVQRINPAPQHFNVEVTDSQESELPTLIASFIRPFDLTKDFLFRVKVIRLTNERHVMLFDTHHIVCDGISLQVLVQEFIELYEGKEIAATGITYKDYAVWYNAELKSERMERERIYWEDQLSNLPILKMPADFIRPRIRTFEGDTVHFTLSEQLLERIGKMAGEHMVSPYAIYLSLYFVLLHKYSSQQEFVVGSLLAGRIRPEVNRIVGMFNQFLPIRVEIPDEMSFTALMIQVNNTLMDAFDHQKYPFEEVVALGGVSRDRSRNPLFDTMLVLHNQMDAKVSFEAGGARFKQINIHSGTSKLDFKLDLFPGDEGRLDAVLEYNVNLFSRESMCLFAERYARLVETAAIDPEKPIAELEWLTEEERDQLSSFNDTHAEYRKDALLHELIEEQAQRIPDNIAFIFGDRKLTYRELNGKANRLARRLRAKGVGPESIVAVVMERSEELMTTLLAVLKAGGAYLPVSPEFPAERVAYMLEDSGVSLVLTQQKLFTAFTEKLVGGTAELLDVSEISNISDRESGNRAEQNVGLGDSEDLEANLELIGTSHSAAYVIYTSGSTGKPKGAVIEHFSIVNRLNWMQKTYPLTERDVILQKTPYTFDVSVWELFWWGIAGASVLFLEQGGEKDPEAIVHAIEAGGVTTMHFVPSMLSAFQEFIENKPEQLRRLSSLRQVFASGEALTAKMANRFRSLLHETHGTTLINLYGPTEATVDVTYYDCTAHEWLDTVPIGRPIDNTRLYIVNGANQLQPIGVVGELCIAGDGLARGYVNRVELTAEKFVNNPYEPGAKMYRTGDLARWMPDGNIEYLGRIDHQVKIRGYRIELGEIENELLKHEAVNETVVTARTDANSMMYLCAYYVAPKGITATELRGHLARSLPEYMIPAYFVLLDRLPLSANGKVDRTSLPEPQGFVISGVEYIAPGSETEVILATLWQELLGVEKVGVNDNFFDLGGNSLSAAQLLARVHKAFGVDLPLRDVFQSSTVAQLTQKIKGMVQSDYMVIETTEERGSYPLSPAQNRLFILHRLDDGGTGYNLPAALEIQGVLDRDRLNEAFHMLIERHESLRTSFAMTGEEPAQTVQDQVAFELEYAELDESQDSSGIEEMYKAFVRSFNLSEAPLLRAKLVRSIADRHYLLFDMHHIISDGISMAVLQHELIALYGGTSLPSLKLQYRDYTMWQLQNANSEALGKQTAYWLDQLSGELPVLDIAGDYPRPPVKSTEGDHHSFYLTPGQTEMVNRFAIQTGSTPFMVLLTAFNVLLSRYAGQEDIIVGTPVAGRHHSDLEPLIGMFVNTLALRNRPVGSKSFHDLLSVVKENAIQAFEHAGYPFEVLVDALGVRRDISRNPVFDAMFVMQNMRRAESSLGNMKLSELDVSTGVSKFDLLLEVVLEDGSYKCRLEYCTKLYKAGTIQLMTERYARLVETAAIDPEKPIAELEWLTEEERDQLSGFNNTFSEYRKDALLHELIEEQAERIPDNIAFTFGDRKLTYRELNGKANRLARKLRAKGVGPESIVAVAMERSEELMTTLLAVLKAGGAYLPVSPEFPAERVAYMLEDSGVSLVLTQQKLFTALTKKLVGGTAELLDVTDISDSESGHRWEQTISLGDSEDPEANLELIGTSHSAAYVIYTSGSTGKPKGAVIEHFSIVNRLNWMQKAYPLTERDVILQKTPYTFDVSVWELFWWGIAGASVLFLEQGGEKDPEAIVHAIEVGGVTTMHFVPSMLSAFQEFIENKPEQLRRLSSLRQVFASGEALTAKMANRFRSLLHETNGTTLINLYGPTEATVDVTYYDCTAHEWLDVVPIGRPIDNTRLYIVNGANQLQPIGVVGELCIAGDGLARGYVNRVKLTAEKFVDNPYEPGAKMYRTGDLARWMPDGNIEYLGRIDHQVKIRGYRIELGEIENELLKHEAVNETVVMARTDANSMMYLCAYYVARTGITAAEIRGHLAQSLPEYMIPAYFVLLDRLLLTANGKVDRTSLPEPHGLAAAGAEYSAPVGEMEVALASLWQDLLGVEKIGMNDNFFDMGGNSLLLIRAHNELERRYPGLIKLTDLFGLPTVNKLAENLNARLSESDKDWKIKLLELSDPYFTGPNEQHQGNSFSFQLDASLLLSLERIVHAQHSSMYTLFAASYLFVLSQHGKCKDISVQTGLADQRIASVHLQLHEINDFTQILQMIDNRIMPNGSSKEDTFSYRMEQLKMKVVPRHSRQILPLIYRRNELRWSSGDEHMFDLALSVEFGLQQVQFQLDYNGRRLRKDKMKMIASDFLKFLKFISEQSAYRSEETAVSRIEEV